MKSPEKYDKYASERFCQVAFYIKSKVFFWIIPSIDFRGLSLYNRAVKRRCGMSDIFGSDFISILDEDGNEFKLEHIMTIDLNDEMYPADMDEQDEDYGTVLLKVVEQDGEMEFVTIDDEAEEQAVYDKYMELLFQDDVPEPFPEDLSDQ
jgi:uncharacterized protein YqkB